LYRKSKKKYQPFSADLKELIQKKKHRLWKHWITSRDDATYNEYIKLRNKAKGAKVKLAQEKQHKISLECMRKKPKKSFGSIH